MDNILTAFRFYRYSNMNCPEKAEEFGKRGVRAVSNYVLVISGYLLWTTSPCNDKRLGSHFSFYSGHQYACYGLYMQHSAVQSVPDRPLCKDEANEEGIFKPNLLVYQLFGFPMGIYHKMSKLTEL